MGAFTGIAGTPKVGFDLVILDTLCRRIKALCGDVDVDIINVIVVGTQEG